MVPQTLEVRTENLRLVDERNHQHSLPFAPLAGRLAAAGSHGMTQACCDPARRTAPRPAAQEQELHELLEAAALPHPTAVQPQQLHSGWRG
mmetsp:Transcript_38464/g.86288  ORF Transcript_38464/g.86288 Transcript_38464/m.86288 type:complete len:91 (-) Transcript_38464:1979-2251(-)